MSRDVLRGLTLCCLLLEYLLRTCTCKYNCDYRNKQKLKVNGLLDLVVLQSSKLGGILIEYLRCLVCLFGVFVSLLLCQVLRHYYFRLFFSK